MAAFFSLIGFMTMELSAADNAAPAVQPTGQNNVSLLAQLGERSKTIQALEGRFEQQKQVEVLPVPLNSSGRFQFEQGKGVVWELLAPVQSKLELTPNGINFGNEQQVSSAQQAGVEVVAKIFMGVIAGELDTLKDYFLVTAEGDSSQWALHLTPHSANLAAYIKRIELRGGEFTEQLDIAEANGDTTRIRFTTDKVRFSDGKVLDKAR